MAVGPAALEAALTRWAEALLGRLPPADAGGPDAFALDGKSARGSFDGLSKAVHLLSLVARPPLGADGRPGRSTQRRHG